MARQHVLDQGEAEAGAALGAALSDIDAVEAFGQARNVFRRYARPLVAHRENAEAVARPTSSQTRALAARPVRARCI